jgi:hypothetical protein
VSFSASLFQTVSGVPVQPVVNGLLGVAASAGLIVFFKPLLTGIFRALVMVVRPRRRKEQQSARRNMRDAEVPERKIDSSQRPAAGDGPQLTGCV